MEEFSPFISAIRNAAQQRDLLSPGDKILVAFSGGPDSMSLLHALHVLSPALGLVGLEAAHLDHGLRGEHSFLEAEQALAWCSDRGIPCQISHLPPSFWSRPGNIQERARDARYSFLTETAQLRGCSKVATAHNADDQAETILIHVLRGSGIAGLAGIPLRSGLFIRPLRSVTRAQVEEYCRENDLEPLQDRSNADPSHYLRNRIRLELIPLLERDYAPAIRPALLRLAEIAEDEETWARAEAKRSVERATLFEDESRLTLDAVILRELPTALLRRTLRIAIECRRGSLTGISFDWTEQIAAALRGNRRLPFELETPNPSLRVRITPRRAIFRSPAQADK